MNFYKWNCNLKITRQIDLVLYYFAYEWCNLTNFSCEFVIDDLKSEIQNLQLDFQCFSKFTFGHLFAGNTYHLVVWFSLGRRDLQTIWTFEQLCWCNNFGFRPHKKTRENIVVLNCFTVYNFDFTRKNWQKLFGRKNSPNRSFNF